MADLTMVLFLLLFTQYVSTSSVDVLMKTSPWIDVDVTQPDAISLLKWIQWEANLNSVYDSRLKLTVVHKLQKVSLLKHVSN